MRHRLSLVFWFDGDDLTARQVKSGIEAFARTSFGIVDIQSNYRGFKDEKGERKNGF